MLAPKYSTSVTVTSVLTLVKIVFNKHDGFYLKREEFITQTNMEDKEQVGYLKNSYAYILILISLTNKQYQLIGCSQETDAKKLLSAIVMANRYQELLGYSQGTYALNPYYLEYIINSCNDRDTPFMLRPSMISNTTEELFVKHFLSKGEFIEIIHIEGHEMKPEDLERISNILISIPQQQIRTLVVKNCKLTDDGLVNLGRALRHNSFTKVLWLDNLNITDAALKTFSGIWQYIPFLEEFHITNCPKLKGEQYFGGFLNAISTNLQLNLLDLSHNSFSELNIATLAEEILNVKDLQIKKLDLSYNCFTPRDNWLLYNLYLKSPFHKQNELMLAPYPIHETYLSQLSQGKKFQTIVFERVSISANTKRKALDNDDLLLVKELSEEITQCVLFQKTIEDVLGVCKRIKDLTFDFPPQHIERLSELLREKINTSYQIEDFYAFSVIFECTEILEVNKSEGRKRKSALEIKLEQLVEEMNRILNFQQQESKINAQLNEIVAKIISNDIRGHGADIILYVKEYRDAVLLSLVSKGIDQNLIENETMETEPFYALESNELLEERSKFLDDKNVSHLIGSHPRLAEYTKIIEIPRTMLQEELNGFNVSSDIVTKNFYDRLMFLLTKPGNPNQIIKHRPDALLLFSKALLHYKWYLGWKQGPNLNLQNKVQYLSERKSPISHAMVHLLKSSEEFKTCETEAQKKLANEYKTEAAKCKIVASADVQKLVLVTDWVVGTFYSPVQKQVDGINTQIPYMVMIAGYLEPLLETNFFDNQDQSVVGGNV